MNGKFNFKAAIIISVFHLVLSLVTVTMVGSGHTFFWQWIAYALLYPLKPTIHHLILSADQSHQQLCADVLIPTGLIINSFIWGCLLSLPFLKRE